MKKFNLAMYLIASCIFFTTNFNCSSPGLNPTLELDQTEESFSEEFLELPTKKLVYEINSDEKYEYETFVLSEQGSFPLKTEIDKIARYQNYALNGSKFFDTADISNTKLMAKKMAKEGARLVKFTTEDGIKLSGYFLDRKKDKVVVVGPGLTNAKEKMAPLAHIYMDYDVLIMNFRGNGPKEKTWNPVVKLLEIDSRVSLAAREEKDVFAAIKYLRNIPGKYYNQVIGHGICYGALIFAKAQAFKEYAQEKLFDKLILDGTWHSLNRFKEKIIGDPNLIAHPQRGGASNFLKWLFGQTWFHNNLQRLIEWTMKIDFDDINAVDYVSKVTVPVLYFYGKDDLTIYRDEFEEIWNCTKSKRKTAIITSNEHVWNHLKQKELYKLICDLFIECKSQEQFLILLNDPDKLTEHLLNRLRGNADELPDENIFAPLKKPKTFWEKHLPNKYVSISVLTILAAGGVYMAYKKGYIPKTRDGWKTMFGNTFEGIGKWFKPNKPAEEAS